MQGSKIRARLHKGQRIYGTHVVSLGNPFTSAITAELELDFIFICTEHMPVDRTEVSMMCQYYYERGISPMVRIPYPSARLACQYIDGGAQGIIAPYVETVQEVKELVSAVRYRPIKGEFLRDIMAGIRKAKAKTRSFLEEFNKNNYLIIMIESVAGVNNLENLLSIEGVDGVLMGPHDLTCSMEIPEEYENPKFISTVVDVIRRCRKMNKSVGIHTDLAAARSKPFLEAGMNIMLHLADIMKMRQIMSSDLATLRKNFGDIYQRDEVVKENIQICIDQEKETNES